MHDDFSCKDFGPKSKIRLFQEKIQEIQEIGEHTKENLYGSITISKCNKQSN